MCCTRSVQDCHLSENMLSGVFPVFHIKSKGVPNGVRLKSKGQKKKTLQSLTCSPSSLFVSFSVRLLTCIHISVVSLMAACYVICVCFTLHWQFLQWFKLDCIRRWRQLSVAILRDVFALLQRWRTVNPWHPPSLFPPPPPTISFRHSDCLLRLVFFPSEWQHMA